jgi:hypothetical protein
VKFYRIWPGYLRAVTIETLEDIIINPGHVAGDCQERTVTGIGFESVG